MLLDKSELEKELTRLGGRQVVKGQLHQAFGFNDFVV